MAVIMPSFWIVLYLRVKHNSAKFKPIDSVLQLDVDFMNLTHGSRAHLWAVRLRTTQFNKAFQIPFNKSTLLDCYPFSRAALVLKINHVLGHFASTHLTALLSAGPNPDEPELCWGSRRCWPWRSQTKSLTLAKSCSNSVVKTRQRKISLPKALTNPWRFQLRLLYRGIDKSALTAVGSLYEKY